MESSMRMCAAGVATRVEAMGEPSPIGIRSSLANSFPTHLTHGKDGTYAFHLKQEAGHEISPLHGPAGLPFLYRRGRADGSRNHVLAKRGLPCTACLGTRGRPPVSSRPRGGWGHRHRPTTSHGSHGASALLGDRRT